MEGILKKGIYKLSINNNWNPKNINIKKKIIITNVNSYGSWSLIMFFTFLILGIFNFITLIVLIFFKFFLEKQYK